MIKSITVFKPVVIFQKHHNKNYNCKGGVTMVVTDKETTWLDNESGSVLTVGSGENCYEEIVILQDTQIEHVYTSQDVIFDTFKVKDLELHV